MFAHASLIRFFCETNRLYETTPASASTTTIASTTKRTSTFAPFPFAFGTGSLPPRVQVPHDGGDLLPEGLRRPQQVDHPGRLHPSAPAQEPIPGDLERVLVPVPEQPVH